MKRKIKLFLNGDNGARVAEDTPEVNYSEKAKGYFLVVKLEGGYNEEADELTNESIEVIWAEKGALLQAKAGTSVIIS